MTRATPFSSAKSKKWKLAQSSAMQSAKPLIRERLFVCIDLYSARGAIKSRTRCLQRVLCTLYDVARGIDDAADALSFNSSKRVRERERDRDRRIENAVYYGRGACYESDKKAPGKSLPIIRERVCTWTIRGLFALAVSWERVRCVCSRRIVYLSYYTCIILAWLDRWASAVLALEWKFQSSVQFDLIFFICQISTYISFCSLCACVLL